MTAGVVLLAGLAGAAALLVVAAIRLRERLGRARPLRASALAGGLLSGTLVTATVVGFTLK
jgi:hypothetical protein